MQEALCTLQAVLDKVEWLFYEVLKKVICALQEQCKLDKVSDNLLNEVEDLLNYLGKDAVNFEGCVIFFNNDMELLICKKNIVTATEMEISLA